MNCSEEQRCELYPEGCVECVKYDECDYREMTSPAGYAIAAVAVIVIVVVVFCIAYCLKVIL